MPRHLFALSTLCAFVLLSAGCKSLSSPPPPPSYPGFDTWQYPGEETLRRWRDASPYVWIGYYLPSPCRRGTSWVGKRAEIERLGWGMAVLYVGQQAFESDTTGTPSEGPILCSRSLLNSAQGRLDAADALARTATEGFAPRSVIFLDVERMNTIPPGMLDYVRSWTEAVLRDGRYLPGLYVHADNAFTFRALVRGSFREAGVALDPPIWVAAGAGFSLEARPQQSGFDFADVWQGVLDAERTWGGISLQIDENVSTRPSPSAPIVPGVPAGRSSR